MMRVHELAKELGMTSKDLIARIQELGGEVKNHMSIVDASLLQLIQGKLKKASAKPAAEPVKETTSESKKVEPAKTEKAAPEAQVSHQSAKSETVSQPSREMKGMPVSESKAPEKTVSEVKATSPAVSAGSENKKIYYLEFPITVGNLAEQIGLRIPELIKALMGLGVFATVNQLLNEEIVYALGEKVAIEIEKKKDEEVESVENQEEEDSSKLKFRPPVVTMMGHVDHGKTSLLDAIRQTNVASKEKGFITQHIGAYGVDIPGKGHVTFLDTPGHEAFTAMRARGANITDVVVIVVAADDGVMPQTIEAIDHAKEAGCPIVVAINKSDLPSANHQKVMTGLQKIDLMPEEWGGKTICIKVSAKTGAGIDQLLEMLLLESEILELKANPEAAAKGIVIEGHLSKGSGAVASVIVQNGTLRVGDMLVCGPHMGRVKALKNDRGKSVKDAAPSYAVEVSGLNGVPEAGESFIVVEDEKIARKITDKRVLEIREKQMRGGAQKHLSLEGLYARISEGNFKELKIIIKADVQGSVEALKQSLERQSTDLCRLHVIHGGAGGINESDVMLAAASDAIVIGFHVKADTRAEELAEKEGVDMRFYQIIYDAVDDVRKAMEGLLEPTFQEVIEGKMQIRKIFKSSKTGNIGGAMVTKGKVTRQSKVRVIRNQVIVFEGKLSSLKRFQDDVREVAEGYECGVALDQFQGLQEGDVLEAFRVEKIASRLAK